MTTRERSEAEHAAAWEAHCRAPKFRHITRELEGVVERESYIYSTPEGAIELWRRPDSGDLSWNSTGHIGGIEVHSPQPLFKDQTPRPGHCQHVWGGQCWTTGSSMAFDQFEHSFGTPDYIKGALESWHSGQFSQDETED